MKNIPRAMEIAVGVAGLVCTTADPLAADTTVRVTVPAPRDLPLDLRGHFPPLAGDTPTGDKCIPRPGGP